MTSTAPEVVPASSVPSIDTVVCWSPGLTSRSNPRWGFTALSRREHGRVRRRLVVSSVRWSRPVRGEKLHWRVPHPEP